MSETIVRLEPVHIPAAMRLNLAAGWNQTEQDWARVMALEPEGCFGLMLDGRLAATATAVCYGRELAWIGMVLTDPEYRGRGYARRLMERTLEFLEERAVEWIKLDATDMGRPLYLKLGFEDESPVERWAWSGAPVPQPDLRPASFELEPALDLEAFGAERSALLHSLAAEGAASVPGEGFAMGRPGSRAAYFGPCVARSPEAARALLEWFLSLHPGEAVFWDILPGNREALKLAEEHGFERRRQLMRMTRLGSARSDHFRHNDSYVYAIAGFEYG